MYEIIFEADTSKGKLFDVALLWAIVLSVLAVFLESVASIERDYGDFLRTAEWVFTILFTIEYVLRIICTRRPITYVRSFFGVIDLLAVIPTYLSLFFVGSHYLIVIRTVRLLRVFRVLKLVRFVTEAETLMGALRASGRKIIVFLGGVLTLVIIVGSAMYVIEGQENGFTSIPKSVYWAVVTLTTVGYGDVIPQTPLGQFLSAILMILGYAIIAVPTGIVSVELARSELGSFSGKICHACNRGEHMMNADYCKFCGEKLVGIQGGSKEQ